MVWAAGVVILGVTALLLRRLLRMAPFSRAVATGLAPLAGEREALYEPIAQEVEVRSSILAIALNDAFEEHQAGHDECAWRLVELAAGEWKSLAGINGALHQLVSRYLPAVETAARLGHLAGKHFRTSLMNDYARFHEMLDQFVFPSRLRFQLHLRVLRQAADAVAADFQVAQSKPPRSPEGFAKIWNRIESDAYDFDLVVKETLLAYRAFLSGLAQTELANFSDDLRAIPGCGVHSSAAPTKHG